MPDRKNSVVPNAGAGLDDKNIGGNQGLEQTQQNWTGGNSLTQPMPSIKYDLPNLKIPQQEEVPKEDINSSISNLASSIDKPSGKFHPEDNSFVSKALVPEDYVKYPNYYFGLDNEDLAGKNQSIGNKLKNGLVKAVGKFGTTLLDGVVDPIYGTIKAISDGKFSSFYDNDFTKGIDNITQKLETNFPNYVTNQEKNASWYSPKHWATANFVGSIFENVGFMAGIATTAWLTGAAGSAFGEAIGSVIPGLSRSAAMGKWTQAAEKLDQIMATPIPEISKVSTYSEELAKITKATDDVIQAKGAYSKFDILNKAQRTIYGGIANIGVASSMSLHATNKFRQNLVQDFITKNGYEPTGEELEKINNTTDTVGKALFGLTAAMGMVTFHGLFKKVLAKKEGEEILKKEIGDLTLQEGTNKLGTMNRTAQQEIEGAGTEYVQDVAEKKIPKTFLDKLRAKTGAVGNFAKKHGSKIYDPWGGVGMLEFSAVQPGVENYYKRKYDRGSANIFSEGIIPGVKSVFSKEGFDALILGGLGAKVPEVISEKISGREKKAEQAKNANTSAAIEGLNKAYLSSYLKATTESIIRGKSLNDSKMASVEAGDKKGELNAKSQELYNYLYPRVKFGLKNLVDHDLSMYKELSSTPEGMKQLADEGIVPKFNDKDFVDAQKDFQDHLDHVQKTADTIDRNEKSLIIRFGNVRDKSGNRVYSDDTIEKMGLSLHAADDASERVKDIIDKHLNNIKIVRPDVGEETDKNYSTNIVNDLFQAFNAISNHAPVQEKSSIERIKEDINKNLADENGFLETNKDIKDQYNKYIDDAIDLYRQKMDYFREYEDMKKNPSSYIDENNNSFVENKEPITPNTDKEAGEELNPTIKITTGNGTELFETGLDYYIGNQISENEVKSLGLRNRNDFSNLSDKDFTILGKDKTGLQVEQDGNKITIPNKLVEKLHIGKVSEKEKTAKSKFYHNNPKDLNNGRIEYNPNKDSLSFVYHDENDNFKRINIDDIFAPAKTFEDLKQDIIDLQQSTTSDANDYPPVSPEEGQQAFTTFNGNNFLKNIAHVYDSTIEPAYEDENQTEFFTQYDRWSRRKNSFENNINNSEWLKKSDVKNPNNLQMISIHHDNQNIHGFNGLINPSYSIHGETINNTGDNKSIERGAIAMVTVLKDGNDLYTVDNDGKKLKKIGEKHTKEDYDKMIFTYRENAIAGRTGVQKKGEIKYYIPEDLVNEDTAKIEKDVLSSAIADRKRILNNKSYEIYTFRTSNGIPNEIYNDNNQLVKQNNSVVDSEIVPKEDLGSLGLLNIATQSTDGKYGIIYDSLGRAMKFKLGSVVLKYGTDVIQMKSRRFNPREANHIYEVLKATAKEMVDSKSTKPSQKYINYLKSILFFSNQYINKDTKTVHDSQIFFDNEGNLQLGNNAPIPLVGLLEEFNPFDDNNISDTKPIKKQILDHIVNQYHATNNQLLKENKPHEELSGFDSNGEPGFTKWDSYQHYLMDNSYPSGKARDGKDTPLTTDVIKPVGKYEAPFKQKYNVLSTDPIGESEISLPYKETKINSVKGEEIKIDQEKIDSVETLDSDLSSLEKTSSIDNPEYLIQYAIDENNNPVIANLLSKDGENIISNTDPIYRPLTEKRLKGLENIDPKLAEEAKKFLKDVENVKSKHEVKTNTEDITTQELKNTSEIVPDISSVEEKTISQLDEIKKKREQIKKENEEKGIDPKRINTNRNESEYREKVDGEQGNNITPERKAQFEEFLNKNLPGTSFEVLPNALKTEKGAYAWGAYEHNYRKISIADNAPIGTEYHEAFHDVWSSYLSDKEQDDLYKEFRNRNDHGLSYTDRLGTNIEFSKATNKDVREAIAEEFREYQLNNKEWNTEPIKQNFFKRLYNFIKNFIFGKPTNIANIFRNINSSFYANKPIYENRVVNTEFSETSLDDKVPESWIRHVTDGVIHTSKKFLGIANGQLLKVVDSKLTKGELFDAVFNDMKQFYEHDIYDTEVNGQSLSDDIINEVINGKFGWEFIKYNWNDIIQKSIDRYDALKIGFKKVDKNELDEANQDSEENDTNENNLYKHHYEENDNGNQRDYDRDIFKSNAKKSAPAEIQFMFSTIAKTRGMQGIRNEKLTVPELLYSPLFMEQIVEGNKMFYKTLSSLSNTDGLWNLRDKFKELATTTPELVRIYKALFDKDFKNLNKNQWRMIMKFQKAFSKQNPQSNLRVIDDANNSYDMDANSEKDSDNIIKNWWSSFKGNKNLSSYDKKGSYIVNKKLDLVEPKSDKSIMDFFDQINFPMTNELFNTIPNTKEGDRLKEDIRRNALSLYVQISKGIKVDTRTTSKGLKAETSIKRLAEAIAKLRGNEDESQYARVDGEYVQTYVLHNLMSRTMAMINQAKTLDNFLNKMPAVKNDVGNKNSIWLNPKHEGSLYDKDGNLKNQLIPQIDGGLRTLRDGVISADMNKVTRSLHMLNKNLGSRGKALFSNIVPGDAKSEFGMQVDNAIPVSKLVNGTYKKYFEDIFKGYLEDEISMIRDKDRRLEYKVMQGKADKLRFFKNILQPDMVNMIHEFANNRQKNAMSLDDFFNEDFDQNREQIFKDQLWDWVRKESDDEFNNYHDNKLIHYKKVNNEDKYFFYGLSTDFIREFNSNQPKRDNKYIFTEKQIKQILAYRLMNLMIHNTELHKVFFGDPAFSKDASKRRKLENSGTESTHTDDGEVNGLNNFLNKEVNKSGDTYLDKNDWGYYNHTDQMKKITFKHGDSSNTMIVSDIANELNELSNEKGSEFSKNSVEKYEKVNGIDAQAYTLAGFHREFGWKNSGEPNEDYDKQFEYWEAKERQDLDERLKTDGLKERTRQHIGRDYVYSSDTHGRELREADKLLIENGNPEVKGSFYIRKNIGAGPIDRNDMMVPNKNKMSELPLFWGLVQGRLQMEDLYFFMKRNAIQYAGPETQQKEGALANNPDLYNNETGKINLNDTHLNKVYAQNFRYHNKIVENANLHDSQKMGTQQRVLSTMDWFGNGIPRDFHSPKTEGYENNLMSKVDEWNNLSQEEKLEKSEMYKLYNDITKTLDSFFNRKFQNALSRLGLKDFGSDSYKLINPEKVVDFLKDASKIYELPDNIKNSIKLTYNPDTRENEIILDHLPNRGALESMVYSIIEKELIRPKMNGGPKVLVSGEMFEKGNREAVYKKDDKWVKVDDYNKLSDEQKKSVRLTSNSYKIYKRGQIVDDKRQKTSLMEVGLPNHFRDAMKVWAKKTDKTMKSDTELLEYLNNSEEGKKLLHGIGFRIPTQGLNSIDAFKVVEFLPQELGDAIVVPAEITTKVGSDFDIDKLNTYMHNFVINKAGLPERIQFIEDTNSIGNLKDLYKANYGNRSNTDALLDDIFSNKTADYIPTLEEYIKENKGKDPYELNSEDAIQNKYFEQLEDSITLPDNYERLMTPNSVDEMKEVEEEISQIRNKGIKEKDSDINYSNQFNPEWLVNERQNFLDAKSQVGTPAMNNVSHAISQTDPIYINDDKSKVNPKDIKYLGKNAIDNFDFKIRLPHNQINVNGKEYSSLSGLVGKGKMYISDLISQVINGTVDAASDPWLSRLLQSRSLLGTALFLERVGCDIENTMYFLNQPIIDEYLKQNDAQRYTSGINPDMNWKFRDDIITNVKKHSDFRGGKAEISDLFNIDYLKNTLTKYHIKGADSLTPIERAIQRNILDEFIKYQMFSGDLFQMQQGTYWGNLRKPNDITIDLKNIMLDYHDQNGIIKGGKENMNNSFMGNLRDKTIQLSQAVSTIFKLSSNNVKTVIDPIKKIFGNPLLKIQMEKRVSAINKAKDSLLDFLVQNSNTVENRKINDFINEMLIDPKTATSNLLGEIQREVKNDKNEGGNLADNLALNKLTQSLKDNVNTDLKNIELFNKPVDAFTSNSLTKAFAELRDNPITKDLYDKIKVLGMLQSGIRDSRTSYNKFLPYRDYVDMLKPAMTAIDQNSDLLRAFDHTDSYYRNNWNDDNIVPKVKMRTDYYTGEQYYPYFTIDGQQSVKTFGNDYKFLSLHEWSNTSKYPVVKITEPIYSQEEMTKMRNENNLPGQLYKTTLYKKVQEEILLPDGETIKLPVATKINKEGVQEFLYKPINAWGKGNDLQEHYSEVKPSVLPSNHEIQEFDDETILAAHKGTEPSNEEIDESIPWDEETFKNNINFKRGDKIKFRYNDHNQEGNITAPFYDNKGNQIGVIVDGNKEILFKDIRNENKEQPSNQIKKEDEPKSPC